MLEQTAVNIHTTAKKLNYLAPVRPAQSAGLVSFMRGNQLVILTSTADIYELEGPWRKLEKENALPASVFESFEWISSWCKTHVNNEGPDQVQAYAGYHNGELVFLLPLAKSSQHGMTVLQWITEPLGQYGDVLCAKGQDVSDWMRKALATIRADKSIDLLRLRHVRQDGLIEKFAKTEFLDGKYYERAPYLDLNLFYNENEYDARYTSTQRKRRKKIRKHLEEKGAVTFDKLTALNEVDAAINASIFEKNAWLSDRGRFNRIMGCPHHVNFLKVLARTSSDSFSMSTTELKAGGNPVSWEIAFQYRGTHFAYITSHVNALTDLSPGRLHMDLSQRAALASGQIKFDLMVPYDQHKESWSSAMIDVNDYYLGLSPKGKIYGAVFLRTLRPLLRQVYHNLPTWALLTIQSAGRLFAR
jgi:CelD/BcsL family acetyltransferase involved in cellulose biosynthesis